jgi:hypothetical protein
MRDSHIPDNGKAVIEGMLGLCQRALITTSFQVHFGQFRQELPLSQSSIATDAETLPSA